MNWLVAIELFFSLLGKVVLVCRKCKEKPKARKVKEKIKGCNATWTCGYFMSCAGCLASSGMCETVAEAVDIWNSGQEDTKA